MTRNSAPADDAEDPKTFRGILGFSAEAICFGENNIRTFSDSFLT
jgi:hypothetical protein